MRDLGALGRMFFVCAHVWVAADVISGKGYQEGLISGMGLGLMFFALLAFLVDLLTRGEAA